MGGDRGRGRKVVREGEIARKEKSEKEGGGGG